MFFVKKYPVSKPMYIITEGDKLHCLLRAPFGESSESGLVSFDIAPDGSLLNKSEIMSTHGEVACHLAASDGSIYAVNYVSGSVVKMPEKLVVHEGCSVNKKRQESAHTHFVCESPDKNYIFVTDLGMDKILVYDKDLNFVSETCMPKGHGVRHLAFYRDGRTIFSANELMSTVSQLGYADGRLTLVDTVSALPDGFDGESTAAAIRVLGDKVYVSNRGHDTISVLDFSEGRLSLEKNIPVFGKDPRDIWVGEDVIICTNQTGNNITVISREGGELLFEFKAECPISVICRKA